ncbi:MAG: efflux RND transporter periplasmic adaptor subunit [Verrucomicrobia bacterium]|nr:efflux RND transporter periplasmic adaptor subunit [Verrucomicrobiota bacterium]
MTAGKHSLDDLRIDRNAPETKRPWSWVALVMTSIALIGSVVGWRMTRPAAAEVRTITVRETAASGQKTVLNASGYVTARRQATVSSKVTGKVIEVLIEEGKKVADGQILARLDASNVEASLKLAQAQLDHAKAALGETKARLEEAELNLKRISALTLNRIASQADLDRAEAEAKSLKARLEQQTVEVSVADRQLALYQQQMDDTIIRAPFAGVVVSKNAQPGEMISPISAGGGFTRTGICTIVDMDSLEIEIDVNESFINRVAEGQGVEATLDAYPDWKIPCKVIAIIPTADRQKATVKVRVGFEKLDPKILPEMGVKVAFRGAGEITPANLGITIPKSAIRKQDGKDVALVVQNGRAERRAVTLGSVRNDEVIVVAGLASGERVVVEGPDKLAEGDRVQEKKP